jgi:alkanesulfonate monooxygenase SsuD/methylene tetrahydromethanopterin reductase-like flavin-dependent oxidoreductase (luciferase family)
MELGLFAMPSHPPERDLRQGFEFDLQVLRWLDQLGYQEAWIGEHHVAPWEPLSAPDLLLSVAFRETERLRMGPGGFLLPFHHPAELANRTATLDHLSQGRLNFGIAASSLPGDWAMFDIDAKSGVHRAMMWEALDLILRLWAADEPFRAEGKFWNVAYPPEMFGLFKPHLKPVQKPHPPIGVAGLSPNSDTLRIAGERGFMPMSLNLNAAYLASHWAAVEAGAAAAGRTASRADWRIVREIFVADTDEEAWRHTVHGPMGRMTEEYALHIGRTFGATKFNKHDQSVPDSDVTVEYCARNNWLIGSPATVAEKLERLYHAAGGFGTLLVYGFDYADQAEAWRNSLELLAREVMPRLKHLDAGAAKAAAE